MSRPYLLGVPADPITFEDLLSKVESWISATGKVHQICTINPEFLVMAQHDQAFFEVLQQTDFNVLDGWGAVWALRLRGIPVPERVTGSDSVPLLMERAAEKGWSVFLLGAAEGIAAKAADFIDRRAIHLNGCLPAKLVGP